LTHFLVTQLRPDFLLEARFRLSVFLSLLRLTPLQAQHVFVLYILFVQARGKSVLASDSRFGISDTAPVLPTAEFLLDVPCFLLRPIIRQIGIRHWVSRRPEFEIARKQRFGNDICLHLQVRGGKHKLCWACYKGKYCTKLPSTLNHRLS
jgi:hypothetical protein